MTLRVGGLHRGMQQAMETARRLGVYAIVRIQDKTERAVGVMNGQTDLLSIEELSGVGGTRSLLLKVTRGVCMRPI